MVRKLKSALILACFSICLAAVLFLPFEGFTSVINVFYQARTIKPLAKGTFVKFDPHLGWSSIPNAQITDVYGPGIDVWINSRGFRGTSEVTPKVPEGKTRILCSGDSFTFGWGVDGDSVWVSLLETLDSSIQTVNMGLGGYGVDQAYLWYMRDGRALEHDIHMLAFISDDFRRAGIPWFVGYEKPVLRVVDDTLAIAHQPKKPLFTPGSFLGNVRDATGVLTSVRLLRRVLRFSAVPAQLTIDTSQVESLFREIMSDLKAVNDAKDSKLVFVFLPTETDYLSDESLHWRRLAETTCSEYNVTFLDMVDILRDLPPLTIKRLFIQPDDFPGIRDPEGHLTVRGNAWAAEQIYRFLSEQGLVDRTSMKR